MNLKIIGILSVMSLSAVAFADPAPVAAEAAPAETAPVAVETPIAAEAATPEVIAPAETAVQAEPALQQPIAAAPEAAPAEEPAAMVAPKAVRGAGYGSYGAESPRNTANTVYYETVYTRDDGVPVRTVYVAQREAKDTTTMESLMGLYPMKFKVGAHGSVGAFQLSGSEWDSDHYDGMTWQAGLMSIIPLNEYSMGIKVGVLYEQSNAKESYYVNKVPTSFSFKQKKLDIPVMFTFKAPSSRIYFDLGAQVTVPLYDKLKISYTKADGNKISSRKDMIDDDYRNTLDWSFIFGFSIMANQYVSLDIKADIGLSDMYEGHMNYMNLDLSSSSFNVGLTLYPF